MRSDPNALSDGIKTLADALTPAPPFREAMDVITKTAVKVIPGVDMAGISYVGDDGQITTMAATDDLVTEVDRIQYELHEGPCLTSISKHATFLANDLGKETEWPTFAAAACSAGLNGLLAFVLELNEPTYGALNLYSRNADAYDDKSLLAGAVFASYAAFILSQAQAADAATTREEQLQEALLSRDVIGQAKGILMEREGATSEEAFDTLVRVSQHLNIKLREIAQNLVEDTKPKQGP
jgi:hypothetical protein